MIDYAITKDPSATLDYTIDWSQWLPVSTTISTSVWQVQSGITKLSNSSTSTTATVILTGGTAGNTYLVTNTITTTGPGTSLIDSRSINITVEQR